MFGPLCTQPRAARLCRAACSSGSVPRSAIWAVFSHARLCLRAVVASAQACGLGCCARRTPKSGACGAPADCLRGQFEPTSCITHQRCAAHKKGTLRSLFLLAASALWHSRPVSAQHQPLIWAVVVRAAWGPMDSTQLRTRSASPKRLNLPAESRNTMISLRPDTLACITRQRPASEM